MGFQCKPDGLGVVFTGCKRFWHGATPILELAEESPYPIEYLRGLLVMLLHQTQCLIVVVALVPNQQFACFGIEVIHLRDEFVHLLAEVTGGRVFVGSLERGAGGQQARQENDGV